MLHHPHSSNRESVSDLSSERDETFSAFDKKSPPSQWKKNETTTLSFNKHQSHKYLPHAAAAQQLSSNEVDSDRKRQYSIRSKMNIFKKN